MNITITDEIVVEHDEERIVGQDITVKTTDEVLTYNVTEGCPEDMVFGRGLEYVDSIVSMIEAAHKAGTEGEDLNITWENE